jgi:hypothetical protein
LKAVRLWYWLGGLVAVAVAALVLNRLPGWGEAGALGLFLGWGLVGLVGEIVALLRSLETGFAPPVSRDARAADGEVGLAELRGVTAEPNPEDPRFRRFVGIGPDPSPASAPAIGARRCPPLLGRVVWVSLFVGRDGESWSDAEVAQAHVAMLKAGAWLEREAIRWGAAVNVELADTYFVADDDAREEEVEVDFVTEGDRYAPADAHEPAKLLAGVSRAAAALGFRDAIDWLARVHPRVEADAQVWLVHVRRAGCSQVVSQHDTEIGSVRLAVCYARESLFPEPLRRPPYIDPVTVAHEVLHLFDASDKYEVSLRSFPSRSVTARDVMRLSESKLSRLRVDPKTAAEIGWA